MTFGSCYRNTYIFLISACGGDMVTPVGSFTSPNYPGQYPHSRTCEWKIKVQRGRKVSLKFDNFNLEPHRNCQFDYIEVSIA